MSDTSSLDYFSQNVRICLEKEPEIVYTVPYNKQTEGVSKHFGWAMGSSVKLEWPGSDLVALLDLCRGLPIKLTVENHQKFFSLVGYDHRRDFIMAHLAEEKVALELILTDPEAAGWGLLDLPEVPSRLQEHFLMASFDLTPQWKKHKTKAGGKTFQYFMKAYCERQYEQHDNTGHETCYPVCYIKIPKGYDIVARESKVLHLEDDKTKRHRWERKALRAVGKLRYCLKIKDNIEEEGKSPAYYGGTSGETIYFEGEDLNIHNTPWEDDWVHTICGLGLQIPCSYHAQVKVRLVLHRRV